MAEPKSKFDESQTKILASTIQTSANVADRLAYSIGRAISLGISPLSMERLNRFTDADMEVIDAYLYRYGSLVSNIQDSIFKSIGELEQEPVSEMSNRDKANLMERIGALPSAATFSSFVVIRNKLMHEYPEEAKRQLERINFITTEARNLVQIFIGIATYCEKFEISISLEHCNHLLNSSVDLCKKCKQVPCVCAAEAKPASVPPRTRRI